MNDRSSELILCYVDGACRGNPGPGGYGGLICTSQQVVEFGGASSGKTTNNRMEIQAIIAASREMHQRGLASKSRIRFLTDSQYVIGGIKKKYWNTPKPMFEGAEPLKNLDLWAEVGTALDSLKAQGATIEVFKVEGHAGVPGNERADEIAVAFSTGRSIDLFVGSSQEYSLSSDDLATPQPGSSVKQQPYYLSLVDGVLVRHTTWSECERRVKGVRGAKFQKAKNSVEEKQILAKWGVRA